MTPVLHPYQSDCVTMVARRWSSGSLRVLLCLPTGGGKTVVGARIAANEVQQGGRVLFLTHTAEIVHQSVRKLQTEGLTVGVIRSGDDRSNPFAPVQVATVQTLTARGQQSLPVAPTLVIVDECHHAAAGTFRSVLAWFPAARLLGLTATPWRLDGKDLGRHFDHAILGATPAQLVDLGHLAPLDILDYGVPDLSRCRIRLHDYHPTDVVHALNTAPLRARVVRSYLDNCPGALGVMFATGIRHSRSLVADFNAAGIPAEHIDGASKDRGAILRRFESGETLVLSNCSLLTEGVDIPDAKACLMVRPTLSTTLYLQQQGRVRRPSGESALLLDHSGNYATHAHPDRSRDYSQQPVVIRRAA